MMRHHEGIESMLRTLKSTALRTTALGALFVLVLGSVPALAATINYGNFGPVPPGVTFTNVSESSGTDPVPLYGPPTPFTTGLDFDPQNFVSSANGGTQDVTDGQLNFGITGSLVGPINSL